MPNELIAHLPSKIVRQALVDGMYGTIGGSTSGTDARSSDWPIFAPNTPDQPDNIIIIKDTQGILQGRRQTDGSQTERFGIQIVVRCNESDVGWEKIHRMATYLDRFVKNTLVYIGLGTANGYFIHSWSRTSGPIPLGKDAEGRRLETTAGASKRYLFTLNGTVALDDTD